jgi:hypothetical protein
MSEFPLWSGEIKPSPPYTGEVFLSSGTFSLTGFLDGLPKRDEPPAKVRWVEDEPNLARMVIEPDPSNTDKPPRPKDRRDKIPDLIDRLLTAIDAEIANCGEQWRSLMDTCYPKPERLPANPHEASVAFSKLFREMIDERLAAVQAERAACAKLADTWDEWHDKSYTTVSDEIAAAIRNRSNP